MNARSLKVAAAGLLLCLGVAPSVYEQSAVLDFTSSAAGHNTTEVISTFTFNRSLILNDIGHVFDSNISLSDFRLSYNINDSGWKTISESSSLFQQGYSVSNGAVYYTFANPTTYANGTTVKIRTEHTTSPGRWWSRFGFGENVDLGVTHSSNVAGSAAGNIRVSPGNPGSNVAPEPGSIALLLTGGAALAGIALRRRRNAA